MTVSEAFDNVIRACQEFPLRDAFGDPLLPEEVAVVVAKDIGPRWEANSMDLLSGYITAEQYYGRCLEFIREWALERHRRRLDERFTRLMLGNSTA